MVMTRFITVHVPLTEKECEKLRGEATRLGEGTVWAALRVKAGLPEKPFGLVKARREGTVEEKFLLPPR
jgi:hypothetical protein